MAAGLDRQEREALCATMLDVGPDAPTLCEGWTVRDLAAHLVVRERRPLAAPGIVLGGPFERVTERAMAREAERNFTELVERIRSGPPLVPWRLPGLGELLNLNEYFVHHEDVRRASGMAPRRGERELQDRLWEILARTGRLAARRAKGIGVELARPGATALITIRNQAPMARITGEPGEISLWMTGRKDAAEVELSGDPEAVAKLETTPMGI